MSLLHKAEDIGIELTARLENVLVSNGAETDIGIKVYRGRRPPEVEEMPCTVIIEGDDKPGPKVVGTRVENAQDYALMAFLPCDPDNPNDAAHKALRDLKRAVWLTNDRPDHTWGGRVLRVSYIGRSIGARADGESFVLAVLEISVSFVENLADP